MFWLFKPLVNIFSSRIKPNYITTAIACLAAIYLAITNYTINNYVKENQQLSRDNQLYITQLQQEQEQARELRSRIYYLQLQTYELNKLAARNNSQYKEILNGLQEKLKLQACASVPLSLDLIKFLQQLNEQQATTVNNSKPK